MASQARDEWQLIDTAIATMILAMRGILQSSDSTQHRVIKVNNVIDYSLHALNSVLSQKYPLPLLTERDLRESHYASLKSFNGALKSRLSEFKASDKLGRQYTLEMYLVRKLRLAAIHAKLHHVAQLAIDSKRALNIETKSGVIVLRDRTSLNQLIHDANQSIKFHPYMNSNFYI